MTNSYRKGYMGEKKFRELCEAEDFEITWHNEDPDKPDVTVNDLTGEIKYRKSIPKTPYKWLEQDGADFVASKRVEGRGKKPRDWLITMRVDKFFELISNQ